MVDSQCIVFIAPKTMEIWRGNECESLGWDIGKWLIINELFVFRRLHNPNR